MSPGERAASLYNRSPSLNTNIGAHAAQLECMHKPVFKDRFCDRSRAVSLRHERHILSLHVSGKIRIGGRSYVPRLYAIPPSYTDGIARDILDNRTRFAQLFDDCCQMIGPAARELHIPAGDNSRDGESAGLDPVGYNMMNAPV